MTLSGGTQTAHGDLKDASFSCPLHCLRAPPTGQAQLGAGVVTKPGGASLQSTQLSLLGAEIREEEEVEMGAAGPPESRVPCASLASFSLWASLRLSPYLLGCPAQLSTCKHM